jgi:hypothetical protein
MTPLGVGIVVIGILSIIFYVRTLRTLKILPDKLVIRYKGKNELEINKNDLRVLAARKIKWALGAGQGILTDSPGHHGMFGFFRSTRPITFKLVDGRELVYLVNRDDLRKLSKELFNAGYNQLTFTDSAGNDISESIQYK